jgi:hypothetical protein
LLLFGLGYKVLLSCSFRPGTIVNQSLSLSLFCCHSTRVSVYLNAASSRAFGAESGVLEFGDGAFMPPLEEHLFSSQAFLQRLAFDVFPAFSLLSGGLIPRAFCSLQIFVVSGARVLRAVACGFSHRRELCLRASRC